MWQKRRIDSPLLLNVYREKCIVLAPEPYSNIVIFFERYASINSLSRESIHTSSGTAAMLARARLNEQTTKVSPIAQHSRAKPLTQRSFIVLDRLAGEMYLVSTPSTPSTPSHDQGAIVRRSCFLEKSYLF